MINRQYIFSETKIYSTKEIKKVSLLL